MAQDSPASGSKKAPPPPSNSSFLYLLIFMGIFFLIILDQKIYTGIGLASGALFAPLIGLGGAHPVLTLLLASVITAILTTILRHVFTDWIHVARVQEIMKSFNQEFSKARKENNLNKIKKLSEKQGDIFKLQADMSGGQFKPMVVTMVVVIPIFAWLLLFMSAPVGYDISTSGDSIVVVDGGVGGAYFLGAGASTRVERVAQFEIGSYALAPGASVTVAGPAANRVLSAPSFVDRSTIVVGNESAGDHNASASTTIVLFSVGPTTRNVWVVAPGTTTVRLSENSTLHAFVPRSGPAAGATVSIDGRSVNLSAPQTGVAGTFSSAAVIPHHARVPWNDSWDLTTVFVILPRWIILYSLFSFPTGQILMRALKAQSLRRQADITPTVG